MPLHRATVIIPLLLHLYIFPEYYFYYYILIVMYLYFFINSFKDKFIFILIVLAIINKFVGDDTLGTIIILAIGFASALIRFFQVSF